MHAGTACGEAVTWQAGAVIAAAQNNRIGASSGCRPVSGVRGGDPEREALPGDDRGGRAQRQPHILAGVVGADVAGAAGGRMAWIAALILVADKCTGPDCTAAGADGYAAHPRRHGVRGSTVVL